ncbi:MAG: SOS response-associated peptidase family protein [Desulfovibrio sp.]
MPGRFGFNLSREDLEQGFGVAVEGSGPAPDYNIAPDPSGQRPVLVVLVEHGQNNARRVLRGLAWGLVPSWSIVL